MKTIFFDFETGGVIELGTVCEYFGIAVEGQHDALVDVRLTAALARRLRDA